MVGGKEGTMETLKENREVRKQTWLEEMKRGEKKIFLPLYLNSYVRAAAGAL